VETRNATEQDLAEIGRIYGEAIDEQATGDTLPLSPADRATWFATHPADRYPVLVAPSIESGPGRQGEEAELRGWASLSAYRPGRLALRHTAEVSYYVARSARRSGVGRGLVEACLARARQLEFRTLIAILLDENTPSRRLLEGVGFAQWGDLPQVADFNGRRVGHLYYGLEITR
jgi:L-amino acid N-acyltransferase YncA